VNRVKKWERREGEGVVSVHKGRGQCFEKEHVGMKEQFMF
jgi:hypothetical protein